MNDSDPLAVLRRVRGDLPSLLRRDCRHSPFAKQLSKLWPEICDRCAKECEGHDAAHCKSCAAACRRCAAACRNMAA